MSCDFQRDCSKVPFSEECLEFCIEKILRQATIEEKINILRLNEELAHAIYKAYNGPRTISSFNDLKLQLTSEQVQDLLNTFRNINQSQLDYFFK